MKVLWGITRVKFLFPKEYSYCFFGGCVPVSDNVWRTFLDAIQKHPPDLYCISNPQAHLRVWVAELHSLLSSNKGCKEAVALQLDSYLQAGMKSLKSSTTKNPLTGFLWNGSCAGRHGMALRPQRDPCSIADQLTSICWEPFLWGWGEGRVMKQRF